MLSLHCACVCPLWTQTVLSDRARYIFTVALLAVCVASVYIWWPVKKTTKPYK